MSLVPLPLQNNFDAISKKTQPDKAMRGRQFERAIALLTQWWHKEFDITDGPRLNIRSQTFREVQQQLTDPGPSKPAERSGKGKSKQDVDQDLGEVIRSEKSLMKHALLMRGSSDTSAQLFTALCRALKIPTRLVVSLQSVPWRSSIGKKSAPKTPTGDANGKGKEKASVHSDQGESSDSMEEVVPSPTLSAFAFDPSNARSNSKARATEALLGKGRTLNGKSVPALPESKQKPTPKPLIRLRRMQAMAGRRLGGGDSTPSSSRQSADPPSEGWPPVFWTEVFSRPDGRWIPVDPTRNLVHKKTVFDPPPNDRSNRMVYVVGLEDGESCSIRTESLLICLYPRGLWSRHHPALR